MHPKPPQILKIEKILGFELTETQDSEDIFNYWDKSKLYLLNEKQEVIGLNVCECKLKNIDFLQHLPNLKELYFGDNQVSDISVLLHLLNLTNLDFWGNQVSDISVLKHLPNLTSLSFSGNQVSDISALQHLPNLTSLNFGGNRVSDISVLQHLTSLTSLNFGGNRVSDTSVLKHSSNLTSLNFESNRVSDISVLQHLTNLRNLNFSSNQVFDISVLQHLTNLRDLNFNSNQVLDISVLRHLTNLRDLNFSSNQVPDISVLQHLNNLTVLWFYGNQVSDISILKYLPNLTRLSFGGNQVFNISVLQHLPNLTVLAFLENHVSDISVLQHLTNLKELDFRQNQVSDISVLQHLVNLTSVNAGNNQLVQFPEFLLVLNSPIQWKEYFFNEGINLYGNPIADVPVEIIQEGKEAIRRFLEEKKGKPLYEAKLIIVGEGEAGKTSLAEKLMNRSYVLATQPTTHGLAIKKWCFPHLGQSYTANIWDFGGQEIYKNTHRFFLTRNSLYILLTDNRKEDTDFNYWLEKIKLLGGGSPVLIVQNEKDKRKKELPDFPFSNIRGVFQVDLADNTGLDKLEEAIKIHFSALENMQRPFPVDWLAVRKALECKTQSHISLDTYQDICTQNNVPEKLRQQDLGQYLHDLGVLLHYKDDDFLQHKIFLQPNWVTKAVYELIDFMGKGQFTAQDAKNLWEQPKYAGTYEQMHPFLLKIIEKFELCYQQNGMYVMPQLLSAKVPPYTWDTANNLQIQFEYAFPLQGIFWRLIVRLHHLIGTDNVVWKEGVIFEKKHDKQITKALVTETYKNKVPTIMIKVAGLQRKDLLAVVMHEIETINRFYNFSETQAPILKVPCNCEVCNQSTQPQLYEYKKLLRRLENKVYEVQCEESYKPVAIRPLLDDVFEDSFLRYEAMQRGKDDFLSKFFEIASKINTSKIHAHIDRNEIAEAFELIEEIKLQSPILAQLKSEFIQGKQSTNFHAQLKMIVKELAKNK
jgi:internalin A